MALDGGLGMTIKGVVEDEAKGALKALDRELRNIGIRIKNIQATAKDGAVTKYLVKASGAGKKLNITLNRTGEELKRITKKGIGISSIFAKTGKLYLFWNLTRRLRTGIKDVGKSAIDFEETFNKFTVSMGNSAQQATIFQNKITEAIGAARTELMDYQASFKNILGGLGDISSKTAERVSESLVEMSLDYASLFNVKNAEAMKKFQSALVGMIRPIRTEAGYDVSKNAISLKAQELGLDRTFSQLNETEKRLIRIILLMEQLKRTGAFNDLARTIRVKVVTKIKNYFSEKVVAKIRNYFRKKLCEHKQKWCRNSISFMQEMAY